MESVSGALECQRTEGAVLTRDTQLGSYNRRTPAMEVNAILKIHDEFTERWHADQSVGGGDGFRGLVLEQHRQNFALWHQEDRARAPEATANEIAQTKRAIDALNQVRNDLVESMDRELLQMLETSGVKLGGELHSETPGMIIDRLSILSLKIFHTQEQVERNDVQAAHRERNRERLELLIGQRQDLAECLTSLWGNIQAGKRYFKLYRQLKMYNDPELNPAIYGSRTP